MAARGTVISLGMCLQPDAVSPFMAGFKCVTLHFSAAYALEDFEHAVRSLTNIDLRSRSPETTVEELSGGQRQGVAIARAMYFKSKLLILDEPTNHLSVKETNKVLDFVVALREQGITSIFISHNLHHIYPIADRIVAMARGEKIADLRKSDTTIEGLTDLIV